MNNISVLDSRNRRNLLSHGMNPFSPPFHLDYSTDTNMKSAYGDSLYINTVHLIPEPLKMNLADSVVGFNEKKATTNMAAETKNFVNKNIQNMDKSGSSDYYPTLAGIASFFTGVFNIMGGMFNKRANSPVQYYDCFEQGYEDRHQSTPPRAWQPAKREDQNKNGRAESDEFVETFADFTSDMSKDFRSIAAHCESKLNQVRSLLTSHTVQRTVRARRPKRAFHEAGSVDELFEDAFCPEDFISVPNETFIEYWGPFTNHEGDLFQTDAPKVKVDVAPIEESMNIVENVPAKDCESKTVDKPVADYEEIKTEVVSSCEDKVSKLKALLEERRKNKNQTDTTTTASESFDLITEAQDLNLKPDKAISIPIPKPQSPTGNQIETVFGQEIKLPVSQKFEPNYFDEVTGKFYSSSVDSEDSFQIVFSDRPTATRQRLSSDCESEDSFIVFEESPDSCYTSNDVFCDDATNISSDSEESDCESDFDSGVSIPKLSHTLSRTFGDLTDGSLYDTVSEDVVDCAFRSAVEGPSELVPVADQDTRKGLLLDEARKREKKKLPAKKVHFSPQPPKVHVMRVWTFAAKQARAGHWERYALDRERFKRRIADVDMAVSWVLKPQHRSRVMFQRFMPWWNAQKRKELAEKKQKEEEERARKEKEVEIDEEMVEGDESLSALVEGELGSCENSDESKKGFDKESEAVKVVMIGVVNSIDDVKYINANLTNVNGITTDSKLITQNGVNDSRIDMHETKVLKSFNKDQVGDVKFAKGCNGLKNGIDKSYQMCNM